MLGDNKGIPVLKNALLCVKQFNYLTEMDSG